MFCGKLFYPHHLLLRDVCFYIRVRVYDRGQQGVSFFMFSVCVNNWDKQDCKILRFGSSRSRFHFRSWFFKCHTRVTPDDTQQLTHRDVSNCSVNFQLSSCGVWQEWRYFNSFACAALNILWVFVGKRFLFVSLNFGAWWRHESNVASAFLEACWRHLARTNVRDWVLYNCPHQLNYPQCPLITLIRLPLARQTRVKSRR